MVFLGQTTTNTCLIDLTNACIVTATNVTENRGNIEINNFLHRRRKMCEPIKKVEIILKNNFFRKCGYNYRV